MARTSVVLALWLSMVMLGVEATLDETTVMHIGGKVMCQDCTQGWSDWVHGSRPIKGSKVSITCLDGRKRVAHYCSDTTDDDGEFNMVVKKAVYGRELNPRDCVARLVSSPDETCNVATNFGMGKTGVRLRQPTVVYRGVTKYLVGPFYYTSSDCDDPDDNKGHQGTY